MWAYPNDVISMSKYPHLSNVLNRKFDDVAKNTEADHWKKIQETLSEILTIQQENQTKEKERLKEEVRLQANEKREEEKRERNKNKPSGDQLRSNRQLLQTIQNQKAKDKQKKESSLGYKTQQRMKEGAKGLSDKFKQRLSPDWRRALYGENEPPF